MSSAESPEYLVSEAQLVLTEARRQKSLRTKDLGEPIQLTGKALALQVHHGFGWIAENTTVARKIDLETGKTLQLYKGHTGPVTSLAFYESLLITGSWDKTIKVWDATTKALVSSTDAHSDFVKCLFVLPSLGLLVSGSSDKIVRFWDISSVAEGTPLTSMGSISSHTRPISCLAGVAISETSATLCTADTMGVIRIWDLVKEEGDAPRWKSVLKTELKQHRTGINEVYLAGDQLWTASADETAQLALAFKPTLSIAHPVAVRCILPLSQLSEPYVITGSGDVIRVYDVSSPESPELLNEVDAHWHDVTALQLWMRPWSGGEGPPASMEPWVISTSLDGTIRKWKVAGKSFNGCLYCGLKRRHADLITPQPRQPPQTKKVKEETKTEFEMTEDEERELAELMGDD
ncbi:Argonaute-like protein [Mycena chlorophos]|uniref:Argonaute-like protein n=1 Tax=Mycena chlorophos TaxID=658473 RepID=A0A8H6WPN8_MYCCL|nr:Argonaute-like protein [Mycena chlorophos]